jgi:hypothetical protein
MQFPRFWLVACISVEGGDMKAQRISTARAPRGEASAPAAVRQRLRLVEAVPASAQSRPTFARVVVGYSLAAALSIAMWAVLVVGVLWLAGAVH